MFSRQERVEIFMSRFEGRRDVFARRWERQDGASGYAPVYADKSKTSYEPFTTAWAERHLIGTTALGIYPLLPDNTSRFIAADFDGDGWKDSTRAFLAVARKHGIPIAIERSRSGAGAHAWCFFTEQYPAHKSRRIFFALLREAGIIGLLEKNENFDRLFPNQDYHSGKGLGNLIALPLQGMARKAGNSIFIDPENDFSPYDDQWQFLNDFRCPTSTELDERYAEVVGIPPDNLSSFHIRTRQVIIKRVKWLQPIRGIFQRLEKVAEECTRVPISADTPFYCAIDFAFRSAPAAKEIVAIDPVVNGIPEKANEFTSCQYIPFLRNPGESNGYFMPKSFLLFIRGRDKHIELVTTLGENPLELIRVFIFFP